MSSRYVWNRYNIKTNYEWKWSSKSSAYTNQAEVQTGNAAYLIGFERMPTIDGARNQIRYTGKYHIIDVTNSGTSSSVGRTPVSTYPYATIFCPYNNYDVENSNVNTSSGDHTAGSGSSALRLRTSYGWNGYIYESQSGSGYWIIDGSSAEGSDIDIFIGSNPDSSSHNGSRIYRNYIASVSSQGPTLQGTVSNASSGAYPNNGSSGSNWYVYQGSDVIDPDAVSIPASIQGGTSIDITVTPSTGKKYGGTVSYTYQYKLDNGGWQALSGPTTATTQQLTVPKGTASVQVQVRANDDLGFTSSTWVSSGAVAVTNNLAPTAPGSIDVANVVSGQDATITLTAATDPDGTVAAYVIERSVDGGGWQQVYSGPALTCTDTVGADWQSVQYRAAAVDNEGAQGPYIESQALPVRTGAVTITGPASGQGEHAQPFDVGPLTLGVTPAPSDPAVQLTVLLDGAEAVSASQAAGDEITLQVDPRVMARGAHTITVTASKEAYTTAMAQYTYTVPAWDGSDIAGGRSGRLEDWLGRKMLPKTLAQDCLGPDGKDMATLITQAQQAAAAAPLEPVVRAAPPSGSFELAPGTFYDFTQAAATTLTFTLGAAEDGKAAAYHVMFKSGSTAATVNLPDGVRTPDGYVIEANRVYELSILQNMLAYMSWGAD